MASETLDILIRESGAAAVKAKIDELGFAADRASRGYFLLQRALLTIGAGSAISALVRQSDMLQNMSNRLQLVTKSTAEANQVQDELFNIANRSRSALETTAQLYTRTALAVKDLGVSQSQTLKFTESLNKATILSGAGAQEAHAALIQLSQGLSSNRLGGDELRSVLEQLPYVADIIAKSMGVARADLRKLGKEGKITAKVILDAFQQAAPEIDAAFERTSVTIGQSLDVLNNHWLKLMNDFNRATFANKSIGEAILAIANHLKEIIVLLGTIGGLMAVSFVNSSISAFLASLKLVGTTMASLKAETVATTAAIADQAAVETRIAAGEVARAVRMRDLVNANTQLARAEVAASAFTVNGSRARNVLTGAFVNQAQATQRLVIAEAELAIAENNGITYAGRLALARNELAAATKAAAVADEAYSAAVVANTGIVAAFSRTFPTLTGAIVGTGRALAGLWAAMLANPITAIVGLVALAGAAIYLWGDQVQITGNKMVNLKNYTVAAMELTWEAINRVADNIANYFAPEIEKLKSVFGSTWSDVLSNTYTFVADMVDSWTYLPRALIAIIAGLVAMWDLIPPAAKAAAQAASDLFLGELHDMIAKAVSMLQPLINLLNSLGANIGPIDIGKFVPTGGVEKLKALAGQMGETFKQGFQDSMTSTSVKGIVDSIVKITEPIGAAIEKRAGADAYESMDAARRANIKKAYAANHPYDPTNVGPGTTGGGGGGADKATFESLLADMNKQIELYKLTNDQREIGLKLLEMEDKLKRKLTATETALATETIKNLEAAKTQFEVLQEIVGPREKIAKQQEALNQLFQDGRISMEDYTTQLKKMQQAADEASGTMFGGFRSSINAAILSTTDFGKAIGDQFVSLVGNAADALVQFAQTGKLNVRQLFAEFVAGLFKLFAQQTMMRLLGSLLGVAGTGVGGAGGIFGGLFGGGAAAADTGILGLPGFANGGQFTVGGQHGVDKNRIQFMASHGERVSVETKAQQRSNDNKAAAPKVENHTKIVNVFDPSIVGDYMQTREGERVVLNIMRRNGALG